MNCISGHQMLVDKAMCLTKEFQLVNVERMIGWGEVGVGEITSFIIPNEIIGSDNDYQRTKSLVEKS